ncbi:NUDIX hydrolase [Thioalbus denitrificans]|uniref:GDP-mannose pyrophosphatase n=1 Tax=Thioalbus denitrificans TaxID=547122 RepID=A0A369CE84_9GAMM|nr:NUDIX hydrolase [Thioalbus denitrificans]RCX31881.1 ADP-ribose pyrophosphatase [Thioalbus denitrificans]
MTGRRSIHRGRVVDLGIETVRRPDGRTLELEVVRHPGGAAVVALDAGRNVCLVRQYRHATGGWLWELPAGKLEPDEPPLATARRELGEEAGLRARYWRALGSVLSTPGFCDEVIHLYLARGLTTVATEHQEDELMEVHWLSYAEALRQALDGRLRDAKTIIGLLRARPLLDGRGD